MPLLQVPGVHVVGIGSVGRWRPIGPPGRIRAVERVPLIKAAIEPTLMLAPPPGAVEQTMDAGAASLCQQRLEAGDARGYYSDALRAKTAHTGAIANIRPLDHRTDPPAFSPRVSKHRNRIERFFNRIKHFPAIATRFDKHDAKFLASVKLAAIRIWMLFNESVTWNSLDVLDQLVLACLRTQKAGVNVPLFDSGGRGVVFGELALQGDKSRGHGRHAGRHDHLRSGTAALADHSGSARTLGWLVARADSLANTLLLRAFPAPGFGMRTGLVRQWWAIGCLEASDTRAVCAQPLPFELLPRLLRRIATIDHQLRARDELRFF